MSMTDRQKRGFLSEDPEKDFEYAKMHYYKKSRQAKNLRQSLYYWAAVFSGKRAKGNSASSLVKEMFGLQNYIRQYVNHNTSENIVYTDDNFLLQEANHHTVDEEESTYIPVENLRLQSHQLPSDAIMGIKAMILDILSVCNYHEKRLFAFIIAESELDFVLDFFPDKDILGDFFLIIKELHEKLCSLESSTSKNSTIHLVGKKDFVVTRQNGTKGNKKLYNSTIRSFREKVRPLFFVEEGESE